MTKWNALQKERTTEASLLADLFQEADAIVVGIGAGMSAADGFTYIGSRFEDAFPGFYREVSIFRYVTGELVSLSELGRVLGVSKSFYRAQLLGSTCGTIVCGTVRNAQNKAIPHYHNECG